MALTQQEMKSLEAMSPEDLGKLLALIREARSLYGQKGLGMSEDCVKAMTDVVDDKQMKAIVDCLRGGRSEPGFMSAPKPSLEEALKPEEPKDETPSYLKPENEKGWRNPIELEHPPGVKYIDQMVDVQDQLDRQQLEKRLRGDR